MALKLLLTVASWKRTEIVDYICLVCDVTRTFVHAPIDELIRTRIPESLNGLEVKVDGKSLILRSVMLLDVLRALDGYRKFPRL